MNQYQKTTEKKKQAIVQAALRLFKDKGFKETRGNERTCADSSKTAFCKHL